MFRMIVQMFTFMFRSMFRKRKARPKLFESTPIQFKPILRPVRTRIGFTLKVWFEDGKVQMVHTGQSDPYLQIECFHRPENSIGTRRSWFFYLALGTPFEADLITLGIEIRPHIRHVFIDKFYAGWGFGNVEFDGKSLEYFQSDISPIFSRFSASLLDHMSRPKHWLPKERFFIGLDYQPDPELNTEGETPFSAMVTLDCIVYKPA